MCHSLDIAFLEEINYQYIIHSKFKEWFSLTVLFVAECKVVDGAAHYHLDQLQGSDRDRDYLRDPIPDKVVSDKGTLL